MDLVCVKTLINRCYSNQGKSIILNLKPTKMNENDGISNILKNRIIFYMVSFFWFLLTNRKWVNKYNEKEAWLNFKLNE